ncbi:MAG: hypothetical protein R2715_11190 [Ilumatobacteraceae bacterium]
MTERSGSSTAARLTIGTVGIDPRSVALTEDAGHLGLDSVERIEVRDVVFVAGTLGPADRERLSTLLVDPLLQHGSWDVPSTDALVVETVLQPGVTDPVAHEVVRVAGELGMALDAAATGLRYTVTGALSPAERSRLIDRLLANPVIERWAVGEIPAPFDAAEPELVPARTIPVRAARPSSSPS